MSKSYGNTINFSDPEPVVRQKLKTMVTDPARVQRTTRETRTSVPSTIFTKFFSPTRSGTSNRECRTAEIGCIDCKKLVANRIVQRMTPIWDARAALIKDPGRLQDIVRDGSSKGGRRRNSHAGRCERSHAHVMKHMKRNRLWKSGCPGTSADTITQP